MRITLVIALNFAISRRQLNIALGIENTAYYSKGFDGSVKELSECLVELGPCLRDNLCQTVPNSRIWTNDKLFSFRARFRLRKESGLWATLPFG